MVPRHPLETHGIDTLGDGYEPHVWWASTPPLSNFSYPASGWLTHHPLETGGGGGNGKNGCYTRDQMYNGRTFPPFPPSFYFSYPATGWPTHVAHMANGRVVAMMEAQSLQVALKYYVPQGKAIDTNSPGGGRLIRFLSSKAPPVSDREEVLI